MGADSREELLNVYDEEGRVVDAKPRREAKRSGRAVGAVNVLIFDAAGRVLLQRRPAGQENGGKWDKSVGGHVSAGEEFDETAVRETGEELFDDPESDRVVFAESERVYADALRGVDLQSSVVIRRVGLQLNLRDVRIEADGSVRNVIYHVAIYAGRSDAAITAFRPQASEIERLEWFAPAAVDRMIVEGSLPPNMSFLWLTHAYRLVR